jgi:hypothetical protein
MNSNFIARLWGLNVTLRRRRASTHAQRTSWRTCVGSSRSRRGPSLHLRVETTATTPPPRPAPVCRQSPREVHRPCWAHRGSMSIRAPGRRKQGWGRGQWKKAGGFWWGPAWWCQCWPTAGSSCQSGYPGSGRGSCAMAGLPWPPEVRDAWERTEEEYHN